MNAGAPRRLARRRGALLLGSLVGVWLVAAGLTLWGARGDLLAGASVVRAVRSHSSPADLAAGHLVLDVRAARDQFAEAHGQLSSVLLAPARLVPVLGRQLRSATALSQAGVEVTEAALRAATQARSALERPVGVPGERVAAIRDLAGASREMETDLSAVDLGPRRGLLPFLAESRNTFADELERLGEYLRRGSQGARSLADLLAGPRRYLLFAANNAEMRAGSGMFLSVGELESQAGDLRLGPMRSVIDVDVAGEVPLEGDLADRWGWLRPNKEWRNLMLSPRFEANAELAAKMWVSAGNQPVDGVIVVDPVALRALLKATGPVRVGAGTIDEGNVVDELLHGQYLRFPRDEVAQVAQRREELGTLARAVVEALGTRSWSVPDLATGLGEAVRGRHLLLWSGRPEEQTGWRALGADGALQPDSLLVSLVNRGGNKLDRFLEVSTDVAFRAVGNDTEVTLRIHLANTVTESEPSYVAGPNAGSGVGAGVYLGLVAVNLPGAATGGRFEGVDQLAVAGRDGPTRAIAFQLQLGRGEQRDAVVSFRLPGHRGTIRVEPSARVPPISWTSGAQAWVDDGVHLLEWATSSAKRTRL